MNASIRSVVWGLAPLGALVGGAAGAALGLRATLLPVAFWARRRCCGSGGRRCATRMVCVSDQRAGPFMQIKTLDELGLTRAG
ncbi:hypothetical protein ACF1BQ_027585 [Bradyrhizobium sp. RDT10]